MSVTETLISKIVDANDIPALDRFGIQREHLLTETERKSYDFLRKYSAENQGNAPSYAVLIQNVPDFVYIPNVTDSYEYLSRQIKESYGKRSIGEFLNDGSGEIARKYAEIGKTATLDEFISLLTGKFSEITIGTNVPVSPGKSLLEISQEFRAEYEKRKAGKSFKLWRTPFASLNESIGGLYSGDIYGIMAESGRGKTYLSEVITDELLRQGARVLVKSYEVKSYPWVSRLISIITAREGAVSHADIAQKVGLPNKAILSGNLEGDIETYFFDVLAALNEYYPGTLYLQAKSDAGLTRTLADLDRELHMTELDAVIIDAFYNLDDCYGRNANKTAGGAAEQAARKLERIIGEHDVVGIYTVQAHTERQETEEGEHRTLKLPQRDQMKTTKALLEITTNLFTFDAVNGNGRLGVDKGRNGGEGFTVELVALMDYGVLRELPTGTEAAAQFVGNF
ncbi:DnaB-like helicase C-terminal domain-containing protein [Cohnella silvisoli]|uniref:DnaB-like helicase C-terminal domain-containing protein n=1 Tax=Cohnella silvisoli TaxID=2873699 RepID=A0ABV1L0B6_9BACL|nr:DnaB-like helicase C-terminal domain-containing protein [Cohnella silvisoli]MCD9024367.1 DNA helicase [Cohnella silvisoli]